VRILSVITPIVILLQYSLGGLVRHLGRALYEHVGMAAVVLIVVAAAMIAVNRTKCGWLRRPAYLMGLVALSQVALGIGAFLTKYGFAPLGYVAVQRTLLQTIVRTSHTVVGMLLLMSSVILLVRVLRIASTLRTVPRSIEVPIPPLAAAGLKGAS
jgi:heme A synthase